MVEDLARHPVEQPGRGRPHLGPDPPQPAPAAGEGRAAHTAEGGLELGGGLGREALGAQERPERLGERRARARARRDAPDRSAGPAARIGSALPVGHPRVW